MTDNLMINQKQKIDINLLEYFKTAVAIFGIINRDKVENKVIIYKFFFSAMIRVN